MITTELKKPLTPKLKGVLNFKKITVQVGDIIIRNGVPVIGIYSQIHFCLILTMVYFSSRCFHSFFSGDCLVSILDLAVCTESELVPVFKQYGKLPHMELHAFHWMISK